MNFSALATDNWGLYVDDSPDFIEARQFQGKKMWAQAVLPLKQALKKEPDFSLAALDLSKALLYSGHRDEAISTLAHQITREKGARKAYLVQRLRVLSRSFLDHRIFQLYQDGLDFLEERKYRAAREKFLKGIEQDPNHVEILLRLGQVYLLDEDHDHAVEKLKSAARLNPYEPEIRLWLGRALFRKGDLNDGLEEIKSAANELPQSEIAPIWLAESQALIGQKRLGIKTLEEDLIRQPFHLQGLISLAKMRIIGGHPDSRSLWSARKELQLALSRMEKYFSAEGPRFESELGVEFARSPEDTREEIEKLLKQVESKLKSLNTNG